MVDIDGTETEGRMEYKKKQIPKFPTENSHRLFWEWIGSFRAGKPDPNYLQETAFLFREKRSSQLKSLIL
jgi:hypothetical protein